MQISKPRAYYLHLSGDDNNTGTRSKPWKTIQKISTVQLGSGDSILFKAGQVFKGTLQPVYISGTSGKPLMITTYGKGRAVIDAGNSSAIIIEKARLVTIKNLELKGAGRKDGNTGDGIAITNCRNIMIDDIEASGFRNAGVSVTTSSNIRITKVEAHDNGFAGISITGEYQLKKTCQNIYIGYCSAYNNPGSPVILDNHSGNGIVAGSCSKLMIEYCVAFNNGWDMPRKGNGPVGIWCYEADSAIIQHCISYRNKTSAGGDDGGGYDLDGGVTNSIIQYCLSYENQGSGFGIFQYAGASAWHNNVIRYNISENDGTVSAARAGIYIWNSSDDATQFYNCLFYNNTIYNDKGSAINFAGESKRNKFAFFNNIFLGGDSLLKGKRTNDVFLGNNWWSKKNKFYIEGIVDLNEWAKKSGQETLAGKVVGSNIDPHFDNAAEPGTMSITQLKLLKRYKIPVHSPLRKKGIDLKKVYAMAIGSIDFNGHVAPAKGIGACF
ncbi:MAG: right-handed parallel beta-helix repeat-containing protein [Ferruginibacter sp.]